MIGDMTELERQELIPTYKKKQPENNEDNSDNQDNAAIVFESADVAADAVEDVSDGAAESPASDSGAGDTAESEKVSTQEG